MEVGGLDGVVTSCIFGEFVCQSRDLLVRFGLRRGAFGIGGHDKKGCVFGWFWILTRDL